MRYNQLLPLGWQPFFQQQLSLDEWEHCVPARIVDYQRSVFTAQCGDEHIAIGITASMPNMTVGDWMVLDAERRFVRLLDRSSRFIRKSAGSKMATQLVAANIDTVFIVSSMNQDFSLNRIERYLALAHEAEVEPVVVLSKTDLCETPEHFVHQVQLLDSQLVVMAVNGLDSRSVSALTPWCRSGKTVALMGSSGVGKSTLVNTLLGRQVQDTAAIREDDDEGRHTTTSRSLHKLRDGGLLLDTPGMRELQLIDCEKGIEGTFADITELATRCRFQDCQHRTEPDCAVLAAIERGVLDGRRLTNYRKLMREQQQNTASLAEKRARDRALGKKYRKAQTWKDSRK